MKRATKEKKTVNNKKIKNNQNNNKTGIFDYESEINGKEEKRKKLTRKVNKKNNKKTTDDYLFVDNLTKTNTKIRDEQEKTPKKKIVKKLQKRANKKNIIKQKEIKQEISKEKQKQRNDIKQKTTYQQIKHMQKIKRTMKFAFIVLLFCISLILLGLSPIFNIKDIKIINNDRVSKEQILGLLNIDDQTNIFKENNSTIKRKLSDNPYINVEKTEIKRRLPSTIQINIKEREVQFLLEFGSTYAYIDKNGHILEISNNYMEGKIKVRGYETSIENIKAGNKLCKEDISKINDLIQIVNIAQNYDIYGKITSIDMTDENDYQLYLESERKTIHFGNYTSADTKMLYIKAILEKEKENEGEIFVNVDLNTKNVYFKQKV